MRVIQVLFRYLHYKRILFFFWSINLKKLVSRSPHMCHSSQAPGVDWTCMIKMPPMKRWRTRELNPLWANKGVKPLGRRRLYFLLLSLGVLLHLIPHALTQSLDLLFLYRSCALLKSRHMHALYALRMRIYEVLEKYVAEYGNASYITVPPK